MSVPTRLPRFLEAATPKKDRPAFPAPAPIARPVHVAPAAMPAPEPAPATPSPAAPAPAQQGAEPRAPELGQAAAAERLAAAIGSLRQESERLAEQARSDALEIGFQVARRILEMELTASPQPLFALIRSAVRRAGEARTITVRLSPKDAARVREAGDRALGELSVAKVELVEDAELGAGDCVVETELGTVDGRLSGRLDELRRAATQSSAEDAA